MASMVNPIGSEIAVTPAMSPGNGGQPGAAPGRSEQTVHPLPDTRQAGEVVRELNDAARIINTNLSFSIDEPTGKTVIKVVNSETKEVIRQIPPEEMLRAAARIKDLLGVLFDKSR